jgi:hypothetical protein
VTDECYKYTKKKKNKKKRRRRERRRRRGRKGGGGRRGGKRRRERRRGRRQNSTYREILAQNSLSLDGNCVQIWKQRVIINLEVSLSLCNHNLVD